MKKVIALFLFAVAILCSSCDSVINDTSYPSKEDSSTSNSNEEKEEDIKYCRVKISGSEDNTLSISIYNPQGKLLSVESNFGTYEVPQQGEMVVSWTNVRWTNTTESETVHVGNAVELHYNIDRLGRWSVW